MPRSRRPVAGSAGSAGRSRPATPDPAERRASPSPRWWGLSSARPRVRVKGRENPRCEVGRAALVQQLEHGVQVVGTVARKRVGELRTEARVPEAARAPQHDRVVVRALERMTFNRLHALLAARGRDLLRRLGRDGACACGAAGVRLRRRRGRRGSRGAERSMSSAACRSRSGRSRAGTGRHDDQRASSRCSSMSAISRLCVSRLSACSAMPSALPGGRSSAQRAPWAARRSRGRRARSRGRSACCSRRRRP